MRKSIMLIIVIGFMIAADTTNGGLKVTVTGQATTTIRWVCKIETTEMTY